jgi:hypothetical protein
MLIEASRKKLKISEIPISYHPRKGGRAKLKSFEDGWRHLRFMLLYEPTAVFLIPGVFLFLVGLGLLLLVEGRFHSMVLGAFGTILGVQVMVLGLYSKVFAATHRMAEPDAVTNYFLKYRFLERELLAGLIVFLGGFAIGSNIFFKWMASGFGELSDLKGALIAVTLAITGIQMIFSAFFLSVLLLDRGEAGR